MAALGAGRILSLLSRGYTALVKPMLVSFNPTWATTDWRAVCGRTACTVLREGSRNSMRLPYPYRAAAAFAVNA